jgi:hypothetical protein
MRVTRGSRRLGGTRQGLGETNGRPRTEQKDRGVRLSHVLTRHGTWMHGNL